MRKVHLRDLRYRVNAGMDIPTCVAVRKGPLDLDTCHWEMTGEKKEVTCKHCIKQMETGGRFS